MDLSSSLLGLLRVESSAISQVTSNFVFLLLMRLESSAISRFTSCLHQFDADLILFPPFVVVIEAFVLLLLMRLKSSAISRFASCLHQFDADFSLFPLYVAVIEAFVLLHLLRLESYVISQVTSCLQQSLLLIVFCHELMFNFYIEVFCGGCGDPSLCSSCLNQVVVIVLGDLVGFRTGLNILMEVVRYFVSLILIQDSSVYGGFVMAFHASSTYYLRNSAMELEDWSGSGNCFNSLTVVINFFVFVIKLNDPSVFEASVALFDPSSLNYLNHYMLDLCAMWKCCKSGVKFRLLNSTSTDFKCSIVGRPGITYLGAEFRCKRKQQFCRNFNSVVTLVFFVFFLFCYNPHDVDVIANPLLRWHTRSGLYGFSIRPGEIRCREAETSSNASSLNVGSEHSSSLAIPDCEIRKEKASVYLVLASWLAALFYMLENTIAYCFYNFLEKLSSMLKLSPSVPRFTVAPLGNGALQYVFGYLSSFYPQSHREANLLLWQFAVTNSDSEVHIVQGVAIHLLVEMLQSPDAQLREMLKFSLGWLAEDSHKQARISLNGDNEDSATDLVMIEGVEKPQDGVLIVQSPIECVAETLIILEEKIHGRVLNHLLRFAQKTTQRPIVVSLA